MKTIPLATVTETERRIDEATAKVFAGTEFDRRHDETECKPNAAGTCCADCGRPMELIQVAIYRAL